MKFFFGQLRLDQSRTLVLFSLFLSLILTYCPAFGDTHTTVQDGSWSDPATWGGSVPSDGDDIVLQHTITYSGGTVTVQSFDFSVNYSSPKSVGKLTINAGTMTVTSGGMNLDNDKSFGKHELTVASGATLTLQSGNLTASQSSQTIAVNGTLNVSSGNVSLAASSTSFSIESTGSVNITAGNFESTQNSTVMDIDGALTITAGNFTTSNSGTVSIGGTSSISLLNGDMTIGGSGAAFNFDGGTVDVVGDVFATADFALNSGTLTASLFQINSGSGVTTGSGFDLTIDSLFIANNANSFLNNAGTTTISGNINLQGEFTNYGTLIAHGVAGNGSGNSVLNNYGAIDFTTDVIVPSSSEIYLFPGSTMIVDGDFTVSSNENLVVGTDEDPAVTGYADLIIKGDLYSVSSGDLRVEQNGRMAVYGSAIADDSGGAFFRIEDGGSVFIAEDLIYPGGGGGIINDNEGGNIGLYVDGTVSVASGNVGDPETEGGYATSDYLRDTEGGGDDGFYAWLEAAEDSPLPVVLSAFKALSSGKESVLEWETASEKNNDYFSIERSSDGISYHLIGTVHGAGTSKTKHNYLWSEEAQSGLVYYRLSQTDYDGSTEVLGVKTLNVKDAFSDLTIYPNPVTSASMVYIKGVQVENISLLDINGRVILTISGSVSGFHLPADLKPGMYFLQLSIAEKTVTERIQVR